LAAEPRSGDEKVLFRLIDDADIPDDGLGFHAQQADEKRIKAVLAHDEVPYERTHNIAYLLALLDGAGIPKPDRADDLPNLSPWAAELRYARQSEAVPNRQEMLSLVKQTKAWAEARLAAAPGPGDGDTDTPPPPPAPTEGLGRPETFGGSPSKEE
jgi:hypothetical protein